MRTLALCALLLVACTGEVEQQIGLFEPLRVPDGELLDDEPPLKESGPKVTSLDTSSGILTVGQRDRLLSGRTTEDAHAIAVRFDGLGSGWWVRPVQDKNPMYPGERDFQLRHDIGGGAPPGVHTLLLSAIDEAGRRGPAFELEVCIRDDGLPDNLNACDATIPPPALVITLEWDQDVDLDLVVETPGGKKIAHATPTSGEKVDTEVPAGVVKDPTTGRLSRDSNAGCAIDGRNSESVVFQEPPARGTYLIYADLFDACGAPGTLFSAAVYRRVERDDGTFALVEDARTGGALVDLQATGGGKTPLYVMASKQP
ncbi:hypothetical protein [Nannocystis sp. SCPEA4]|uniref:hypothetical protein n=1 Tax=Nannocystis sp. SCPEA4 TaxID=2996787 RepID=UPI00226EE83D|nr:hypothetical protein [Nannocystis sp. SCPEA4]MCY1059637.1 hypothetical protein [Nannocystis sp. SCPEA4]